MLKVILAILSGCTLCGCYKTIELSSCAVDPNCTTAHDNPITPQRAMELARPYLQKSFELRQKDFGLYPRSDEDYLELKGSWYYAMRGNIPVMNCDRFSLHAVKIHKKTGQVIPPQ